jgi:secretion/DNA translocation related CpaE-like protein
MRGAATWRRSGTVLAVLGASGGVGASVLATAVAVRAQRAGVSAVLVDAAPLGGGLDVTVGVEQDHGVRWPDLGGLVGSADGRALLARLPSAGGLPVLSFDRVAAHPSPEVAAAVLAALAAECELVVVDVAVLRGAVADAGLDLATQVVLVASSRLRDVAALSVVVDHLRTRAAERVVPEMAVCLRGRRRALAETVRVVELEVGVPVAFTMDDDAGVRADLVHGVAPGSRSGGEVVATADEVLGWAVLPGRGAA